MKSLVLFIINFFLLSLLFFLGFPVQLQAVHVEIANFSAYPIMVCQDNFLTIRRERVRQKKNLIPAKETRYAILNAHSITHFYYKKNSEMELLAEWQDLIHEGVITKKIIITEELKVIFGFSHECDPSLDDEILDCVIM